MVNSISPRPAPPPVSSDPATTSAQSAPRLGSGLPKTNAAGSVGADQLHLSTGNIINSMAAAPPIDRVRVEKLGAEVAAGTYQLSPERIADALFRDAMDILE